jgi:preprotein translocase subunit SecE
MDIPKVSMPKIGGSPIQFFKEVLTELGKVSWPSKQEVIRMTLIVLGVSAAVSLFISSLDFLFTKLMEILI